MCNNINCLTNSKTKFSIQTIEILIDTTILYNDINKKQNVKNSNNRRSSIDCSYISNINAQHFNHE